MELHIEPYQGNTEQMVEKPNVEVNIIIAESVPDKLKEIPDEAEDNIAKKLDPGKTNRQEEINRIWDRIVSKPP